MTSSPSPTLPPPDLNLYARHGRKSLSGIALRSFCLGIALSIGVTLTLTLLVIVPSSLWRLPFFLAALSLFHFLEFYTTAAYNTPAADIASFLLTANWPAYAIAHSAAAFECLVTNLLWPERSWAPMHAGKILLLLGWMATIVGQTVRSAAMVKAGMSFNHVVQQRKGERHVLVTDGVYAVFRHPSYFGFWWWALGTQMVMGNVICFWLYTAVLWRFFSGRIKVEEEFLVKFFGEDYVNYRKRVGTKIPGIP